VSFVVASLLAWRSSHVLCAYCIGFSRLLGVLSFCFLAACSCWIVFAGARLVELILTGACGFRFPCHGLLASLYGVINAAWTRVRRVAVKLPNLPESWKGRVAALVSDTHLGHVRGARFCERL